MDCRSVVIAVSPWHEWYHGFIMTRKLSISLTKLCSNCKGLMSGSHHTLCDGCWNRFHGLKVKRKNPKRGR